MSKTALKNWEVCYDYGPHMSDVIIVQADTEEMARIRARLHAAKNHGRHILINWVKEKKMARETKAQRLARQDEERAAREAAREAQERAEYFPRVMRVLARATNLYWLILVRSENMFELSDRNNGESYIFSAEYDPLEEWRLAEAESAMDRAERELEEAKRKTMLRAAALNKLSAEEREALGL